MTSDDSDVLKTTRGHLEDWPYVPHYLQSTLDHQLIGSHGEAILYRALNIGRVVAFVGSGVSMSYGRLSWKSLVQTLVEAKLKSSDGVSTAKKETPAIRRIRRTLIDLNITARPVGGELQSGRYPAAFQFCEQVSVAKSGAEGRQNFRDDVKRLLKDDAGHAGILLEGLIADLAKIAFEPETSNDLRDVAIAEFLTKNHWRDAFAISRVSEMFPDGEGSAPFHDFRSGSVEIKYAQDLIKAIVLPENPLGRFPLHRFLVAAAARLKLKPFSSLSEGENALWTWFTDSAHFENETAKLRTEFLPPYRDPLAILAGKLRIGRFITTNFDLDIERLIAERGFAPEAAGGTGGTPAPSRAESANPLGETAAVTVFKASEAASLIEFAINNRARAFNLVHLHGRAADEDDLVVTERDYLELYLKHGPEGEVVSGALEIGFGSNPLLFVGNGMGEDDILRPLRQFVSERSSGSDRQAVALLPALGTAARSIEETIAIYSRYGVYTVHFGYAALKPEDGDTRSFEKVRWLELTAAMAADLGDMFKNLKDWLESKAAVNSSVIRGVILKFDRGLKEGLKTKTVSGSDSAEDIPKKHWIELVKDAYGDNPEIRRVMSLDGVGLDPLDSAYDPAAAVLYPEVETKLLVASWEMLRDLLGLDQRNSPSIADLVERVNRRPPVAADQRIALHRVALAYHAALVGIPDSLMSLSLCAKLHALHAGWMAWKDKWYALPIPRLNGGPSGNSKAEYMESVFERHPIALRDVVYQEANGNRRVPAGDRFFAGAPSQTFRTLFDALKAAGKYHSSALNRTHPEVGRRIFVLAGARGVGKGHFFEAFRAPGRIDEFAGESWPKGAAPKYAAVVMLNLSFSTEVTSAFDRLINILVLCRTSVFQGNSGAIKRIYDASRDLKRDRIGRLTRVLELYSEYHTEAPKRVLIAFNAFNNLFNLGGQPKNGQAARLIEALFAKASEMAPFDLMLVCGETGFPQVFQKPMPDRMETNFCAVKPIPLELLIRADIDEDGRRSLAAVVARTRANITGGVAVSGRVQRIKIEKAQPAAFFHVLRMARASLTIGTYFPLLSLALAATPGCLSGQNPGPVQRLKPLPDHRVRRRIQQVIMCFSKDIDKAAAMKDTIPEAMVILAQRIVDARDPVENEFENKKLKDLFNPDWDRQEELKRIGPSASKLLDGDFKFLFRLSGQNRFVLSLTCAAASEAATCEDGVRPELSVRWLQEAAQQLIGARQDRTGPMITYVLRYYQSRHDAAMPLPPHCDIEDNLQLQLDASGSETKREGVYLIATALRRPEGWKLQQQLLWHLGVCNHPVEADVLAAAPKIRSAIDELFYKKWRKPQKGEEQEKEQHEFQRGCRVAVVEVALDILVHRCLVFRLWGAFVDSLDSAPYADADKRTGVVDQTKSQPSEPEVKSQKKEQWRFALHRLMQRSIYFQLHAPSVEFPNVDPYTLSIYGTLPDDLPRPRAEAIQDLDALISAWTGFPRDAAGIDREDPYHVAATGTAEDPSLPSRMLRAAYGVIRSVYSVGVVSRFNDFGNANGALTPPSGHFEQHRLHIRWLIKKAVSLHSGKVNPSEEGGQAATRSAPGFVYSGNQHPTDEKYAPFYSEEIVWLYNECGLLSLIQGRLSDAVALFDRALAAARRIETSFGPSPLQTRIAINKAIADIERGQIARTRELLGSVARQGDEHPAIRAVAEGYLGLCAHVNGDVVTAKTKYELAIDRLRHGGQSRGVAVFSRHLADLLRASGSAAFPAAYTAVDQALAHARKSGHEDVRQFARLARVRIDIAHLPRSFHSGAIQDELDGIETYAAVMGMPRLTCQVAYARAKFLLSIGETQHATTLARKSLQIATMFDLKLRQVSALALLARIYRRRGLHEAAEPLFALAQTFATQADYMVGWIASSDRIDSP